MSRHPKLVKYLCKRSLWYKTIKVYTLSIFCLVAMTCSPLPEKLLYLLPFSITNTHVRVVSMVESCCLATINTDQNPDLLKSGKSFLLPSREAKNLHWVFNHRVAFTQQLKTIFHQLHDTYIQCSSLIPTQCVGSPVALLLLKFTHRMDMPRPKVLNQPT